MWFFPGFGIRPGRKVTWSKVLQVLRTRGSTKYEYVAIYVDDLLIACDCASEFIHTLKRKHNLKIKADGPLKYHLGCDYHMDPDCTLVAQPKSTSPRS